MYKLEFLPDAEVFYHRLYYSDRSHFERIKSALASLSKDPFQGKALRDDFKGKYSFRVGFYRIIYTVSRGSFIVYVFNIGHRRDVYN